MKYIGQVEFLDPQGFHRGFHKATIRGVSLTVRELHRSWDEVDGSPTVRLKSRGFAIVMLDYQKVYRQYINGSCT